MESKRISTLLMARFRACGKLKEGKIRNLSLGGLFVGTTAIPPTGESVKVGFRLPDGRAVSVSGLVWWTTKQKSERGHRTPGFGLRLIETDPIYEQAVRGLVAAEAARF